MRTTDFDFELPPELIAQYPATERSAGRLLHLAADPRLAWCAGEGFRLTTNNGASAGQIVFHFHVHIFGGRPLGRMVRKD